MSDVPFGHPFGCNCSMCVEGRYQLPQVVIPGPAPEPCPAWADGQHHFQNWGTDADTGQTLAKRCACGKTVERKR